MTPSIKTLQRIPGVDADIARTIKEWLKYCQGENTAWASTACGGHELIHVHPEEGLYLRNWKRSLYSRPTRMELAHAAIALILTDNRDTSWEVCQPQEEWPNYAEGPAWEAVNLGDPYITTLVLKKGKYRVMAVADLIG